MIEAPCFLDGCETEAGFVVDLGGRPGFLSCPEHVGEVARQVAERCHRYGYDALIPAGFVCELTSCDPAAPAAHVLTVHHLELFEDSYLLAHARTKCACRDHVAEVATGLALTVERVRSAPFN